MKKTAILLMIMIYGLISGKSILIDYNNKIASESIHLVSIEGTDYLNINELNKAFKAIISEDLLDNRLSVNLYDKQLIFLLGSSYLQFQAEIYNMTFPIINSDGKYFVPATLLTKILPLLFDPEISFTSNIIIAKIPIDDAIKRIVLDPGHGGKDPGAIGFSKKNFEKEVTLNIVKKVKEQLEKKLKIEVILTRDKDEFVSLQQRTKLANETQSDLFISIHCNAHRSAKASGIEVYYLSTAKTDDARAVEALENSVVYEYEGGAEAVKKYDDLAFILADMAQSEHLEESYRLALDLQTNLKSTTGCKDRGVKQANFYVLRGAFMPAVLIELGFISNKDEEKKLIKSSYQNKLVESICESVLDFKKRYDQMN